MADPVSRPLAPPSAPLCSVYVAAVRALFLEYFNGMGIDMTFQNVAAELDNLPGAKYSADAGGFLYLLESVTAEREGDAAAVVADGEAAAGITLAGCIALRDLGSGIAEAKRLYVRPAWRGRDLGRLLLVQIIDVARQAGYATIRLDTLARFKAANAIYAKLGFQRIDPYNYNPEADVLYFELPGLQSSDRCYTQGRERYFCEVPNAHPTPSPIFSPNPDVESATPTPCH